MAIGSRKWLSGGIFVVSDVIIISVVWSFLWVGGFLWVVEYESVISSHFNLTSSKPTVVILERFLAGDLIFYGLVLLTEHGVQISH
jgi:hypothetical protein